MDREAQMIRIVDGLKEICEYLTKRVSYLSQRQDMLTEEVNHLRIKVEKLEKEKADAHRQFI